MRVNDMKFNRRRRASAVALSIVMGAGLLILGLVYLFKIQNATAPTYHVDERVRVKYLAEGLAEFALLKFQAFPSDYYNTVKFASETQNLEPFRNFVTDLGPSGGSQFILNATTGGGADQPLASFNDNPINIAITDMNLHTDNRWNVDVLTVTMVANYRSMKERRDVSSTYTKTYRLQRTSSFDIPSSP